MTARYYTEPRLLDLRGRLGWESIPNFRGAKLMGQTNVRICPGSLEYRSRAQVQSIVQYYASMGWITGQQAMSAIERGQLDYLTQSFDLDVRRISRIIERIKDGTIMEMPTRTQQVPAIDPATGQPAIGPDGQPLTIPQEVPVWMPDTYDNVPVLEREPRDLAEVRRLRAFQPGSAGGRAADVGRPRPPRARARTDPGACSRWRWHSRSGWATRPPRRGRRRCRPSRTSRPISPPRRRHRRTRHHPNDFTPAGYAQTAPAMSPPAGHAHPWAPARHKKGRST